MAQPQFHCYANHCLHGCQGEEAGAMIECGNCSQWYHKSCLSVNTKSVILGLWVCRYCEDILRTHTWLLSRLEIRITALETLFAQHDRQLRGAACQPSITSLSASLPIHAVQPPTKTSVLLQPSAIRPTTQPSAPASTQPWHQPDHQPSYASALRPPTLQNVSGARSKDASTFPSPLGPPPSSQTRSHRGQALHRQKRRPHPLPQPGLDQSSTTLTACNSSEIFHISYLSASTTASSLSSYCEARGYQVLAMDETSVRLRRPWRSFRVRLSTSDTDSVLCSTLWPVGVTCALSTFGRTVNPREIWGTACNPNELQMSYSPQTDVLVSNCALASTDEDMRHWVNSHGITPLEVKGLPVTTRSTSRAFRITASPEAASTLLVADFWPDQTTYRIFRHSTSINPATSGVPSATAAQISQP